MKDWIGLFLGWFGKFFFGRYFLFDVIHNLIIIKLNPFRYRLFQLDLHLIFLQLFLLNF